jgi:outer membrane lipoprotein-sorting protein
MKAKLGLLGVALTLCLLHIGRTQEPTAQDVLKRVAEVYRGANSYQDTSTMAVKMKMMGMEMAIDMSSTMSIVKPNKMSMSLKMNVMGTSNDISMVSDGKKRWIYMGAANQYTEEDAPPSLSTAFNAMPGGGMTPTAGSGMGVYNILTNDDPRKALTENVKNLKLVGSEDIGGKSAYVLTWDASLADLGKDTPFPLPTGKDADLNIPIKTWVSKDDGVILQMTMDMSSMMKAIFSMMGDLPAQAGQGKLDKQQQEQMKQMMKDIQMTLVETHKDVKINAPIADETFAFKPPADAKKVKEFDTSKIMGGIPGLSGMPGGEEPPSPLLGKPAPDFTLKDRLGRTIKLSQLRGKPVMLNFWAEF